ncbi:MAG: hypothetical protein H6573_35875 [Lewinellaceae bacterium]|nr:hypothetical protein [Lewinellaceae bacterium]
MQVRVEGMNYNNRIARAMIWSVFLGSISFGALAISGTIGSFDIILAITVTLLSFLRHLPWYKFYLTKVEFETTQVKVEFYEYDDLHTYTIPIDQIKVTKDKAFGIGSSIKLNFFQNNGLLFYQYQVIGWRDRKKILSIYSQFDSLGSARRSISP